VPEFNKLGDPVLSQANKLGVALMADIVSYARVPSDWVISFARMD